MISNTNNIIDISNSITDISNINIFIDFSNNNIDVSNNYLNIIEKYIDLSNNFFNNSINNKFIDIIKKYIDICNNIIELSNNLINIKNKQNIIDIIDINDISYNYKRKNRCYSKDEADVIKNYYNLNSSLFLFDEELNEYYISFDSIYDKSVLNAIKTIANNIYNEILLGSNKNILLYKGYIYVNNNINSFTNYHEIFSNLNCSQIIISDSNYKLSLIFIY